MTVSKKALLLLVLLIGAVGVITKFLLDPFGSKNIAPVAVKKDEVVVENIPTQSGEKTGATTPQTTAPSAGTPTAQTAKKLAINTTYGSPAGPEAVGFTLTVDANGVVIAADTTVKAGDSESIKYQERFQKELPGVIVGKKLSDLTSIDRVGRASLTTAAFNTSLSQLKAQL